MKSITIATAAALLLITACSNESDTDTQVEDVATLQAGASQFPTVVRGAYAPWAKMKSEAYSAIHPEDAPGLKDIDIPPFHDSYIINSGSIGEGPTELHFITLICSDAPEAVQDFYLRELVDERGWSYESQFHVFQPGSGNDFIVNNTPFVSVTALNHGSEEVRSVDEEFLENFKTRVQITYR